MKDLYNYIVEAKSTVENGGLTFKEGDRVIYLKKYKDEDGEEYEEEVEGTISEIFPSKKINLEFGEGKFVVEKGKFDVFVGTNCLDVQPITVSVI